MAPNFPEVIDTLPTASPTGALNDPAATHASQHGQVNDAIARAEFFVFNRSPLVNIPAPAAWAFSSSTGTPDTVEAAHNRIILRSAGTSGNNILARLKSAPSAPYNVSALISATFNERSYLAAGLCWRDSASSKILTFGVNGYNGTGVPRVHMAMNKWVDETTPVPNNGSNVFAYSFPLGPYLYLRLEDNGTSLTPAVSVDGTNWIFFSGYSQAKSGGFINPNQVGFFINTINHSGGAPYFNVGMVVEGWQED